MKLAVLAAASTTWLGCTTHEGDASKSGGPKGGEVVVFAAASLTDAFGSIETAFEKQHPNVQVTINFAGSQSLRTQIENGARPEVFASANPKHMDALAKAGLVGDPVTFAFNELVIVVPADNPAGIQELGDLPKAERLVIAGEAVPAGAYALAVLESAKSEHGDDFADRVQAKVVSRENNVRQTLQKVVLGEADAALVYATDATSAGDQVKSIPIPPKHNVKAEYHMATVEDAPRAGLSRRFVEFVTSEAGQAQLQEFGFRQPESGK